MSNQISEYDFHGFTIESQIARHGNKSLTITVNSYEDTSTYNVVVGRDIVATAPNLSAAVVIYNGAA